MNSFVIKGVFILIGASIFLQACKLFVKSSDKNECLLLAEGSALETTDSLFFHSKTYVSVACYPPHIPNLRTMDVKIYSRSGGCVFESSDTSNKWVCNGICPGNCEPGNYFAIVKYTTEEDSSTKQFHETIFLTKK